MIALVCLLSVSAISAADTNNIDDVVAVADAGTFDALQEKITNATSGSTIYLENDYTQTGSNDIIIDKNLTIDGKGHLIDAKKQSRIFNITNGVTVALNNITFINGYAAGYMFNSYGGSILNNGTLTIENCQFINSTAMAAGGAISSNNGSTTVINSSFINNNVMTIGGGAIYSEGDVNLIVLGSSFVNTQASISSGGAIYSKNNVTIRNSTFKDIMSLTAGGAIYHNNGDSLTVIDSSFINTKVTSGAGGAINT